MKYPRRTYLFILAAFLLLLFVSNPLLAEEPPLSSYKEMFQKYQRGAAELERWHTEQLKQLKAKKYPPAKEQVFEKALNEAFRAEGTELTVKYKDPIWQRAKKEANLRTEKKIKNGAKVPDSHTPLEETGGTKPLNEDGSRNKNFGGTRSDTDLGGGQATADEYHKVLKDMGLEKKFKVVDTPGHISFEATGNTPGLGLNATINKGGFSGIPGSAAHQTKLAVDAASKETYLSHEMQKNQPGRDYVEYLDHRKKTTYGDKLSPKELISPANSEDFHGYAKGASKIMAMSTLPDNKIQAIMKKNGLSGTPEDFHRMVDDLKGADYKGPGAVGLDETNVEAFKKTADEVMDLAGETTKVKATEEMDAWKKEKNSLKEKATQAEKAGDPKAAKEYNEKVQKMQELEVDSNVRIEEGAKAHVERQKKPLSKKTPKPAKPAKPGKPSVKPKNWKKVGFTAADIALNLYGWNESTTRGMERAVDEEYDDQSMQTETTAFYYSLWYASSIPDAADVVSGHFKEYMNQYYQDKSEGKDPSKLAYAAQALGWGILDLAEGMFVEPIVSWGDMLIELGSLGKDYMDEAFFSGDAYEGEKITPEMKEKLEEYRKFIQDKREELKKTMDETLENVEDEDVSPEKTDIEKPQEKTEEKPKETAEETIDRILTEFPDFGKEDAPKGTIEKELEKTEAPSPLPTEQPAKVEKVQQAAPVVQEESQEVAPEPSSTPFEQSYVFEDEQQAEPEVQWDVPATSVEPSTPTTSSTVSSEPAPASTSDSDYYSRGMLRVQGFYSEIGMGLGPYDDSRDIWGPIQMKMVEILQDVMNNRAELIRIGKLSDYEWKQEVARMRNEMGANIARIASGLEYNPAYENLLNNWASSGYITREVANAAIESMKSTGEVGSASDGASGSVVDHYYIEWWSGNFTSPIKMNAIPVSYGSYTNSITIQGMLLYTMDHDQAVCESIMEEIAREKASGKPWRLDIYPGKAELVHDVGDRVEKVSQSDTPISESGGSSAMSKEASPPPMEPSSNRRSSSPSQRSSTSATAVCPVDGRAFDPSSAPGVSTASGSIIRFCSNECKDKYMLQNR